MVFNYSFIVSVLDTIQHIFYNTFFYIYMVYLRVLPSNASIAITEVPGMHFLVK